MLDVSNGSKMDPTHFLDGLFVPRSRKGQALYDVRQEFDNGIIEFRGEQLSAEDQSILLAIAARTTRSGVCVAGDAKDLDALQRSLLEQLELSGGSRREDRTEVEVTARAILKDAGFPDDGRYYGRMVESLKKLSTTSLYRSVGKRGGSSKLLSFEHDEDTKRVRITLNWRLAGAIFGGAQYVNVDLRERRHLSATAQILHAWLSANVREGQRYGVGRQAPHLETLVPHVWGKRPVSDSTHRNRLSSLRHALGEIEQLDGWVARAQRGDIDGSERAIITRPKRALQPS